MDTANARKRQYDEDSDDSDSSAIPEKVHVHDSGSEDGEEERIEEWQNHHLRETASMSTIMKNRGGRVRRMYARHAHIWPEQQQSVIKEEPEYLAEPSDLEKCAESLRGEPRNIPLEYLQDIPTLQEPSVDTANISDSPDETSSSTLPQQFGGALRLEERAPKKAFSNALQHIQLIPSSETGDLLTVIGLLNTFLEEKLKSLTETYRGLKAWVVVDVKYYHADKPDLETEGHLHSNTFTITDEFEIPKMLESLTELLLARNGNFIRDKSGLVIKSIGSVSLSIAKFTPLAAHGYAKLPQFLSRKKAIVNVQNDDTRCFGYAILSALKSSAIANKNKSRASTYDQYFGELQMTPEQFPVSPNQIPDLEKQLNISINVFSFFDDEGRGRYPIHISTFVADRQIDLLYWKEHFAWIRNFDAFMFDATQSRNRKFFCRRCLGHFTLTSQLEKHLRYCAGDHISSTIYSMPDEGSACEFKKIHLQLRCPFVAYADFECLTEPALPNNVVVGHQIKRTQITQNHTPCSAGLKLVSDFPQLNNYPYESFTGVDCVQRFLRKLLVLSEMCMTFLVDDQRLIMTPADETEYQKAEECHICRKPFNLAGPSWQRVRDHDHITGRFRGAAHSKCNLGLRKTYKIPIFIHNFRGYDSHLIVMCLEHFPTVPISIIGQGLEKYLTLAWGGHLVFKDSFQFLDSSLETLISNLKACARHKFKQLDTGFATSTQAQRDMLVRKGVYPYDFMTGWNRLDDPQLLTRVQFFNKLRQEACRTDDYAHAQLVWREFGCQTMRDYHELYLKTDVLLLADVFETFRQICHTN
jgi:hypothetical protein